jgi:uridylate kinase
MGDRDYGIDAEALRRYALEIEKVHKLGVEIGIVIGGGNIYRGIQAAATGIDRSQGDHMGMMATLINGMALQSALESVGLYTRLQSAIKVEQVCEPFIRRRAIRHLEKGRVVIFSSGTGNPYFTTDTAAALRAVEIDAEVILKGTRVKGIYDVDPETNAHAVKYDTLSYDDAYSRNLRVMDMTAFTLCKENHLPIMVFDVNEPDNFKRVVMGENIGTFVS